MSSSPHLTRVLVVVSLLHTTCLSSQWEKIWQSSMNFTWKIINFTELTENCYYSKVFRISGNNWQILVYPKGNNTDHLSLYLVVADSADLTPGWTRFAEFNLTMINQTTTDSSIKIEASIISVLERLIGVLRWLVCRSYVMAVFW